MLFVDIGLPGRMDGVNPPARSRSFGRALSPLGDAA
jgi:hypothetical protein